MTARHIVVAALVWLAVSVAWTLGALYIITREEA